MHSLFLPLISLKCPRVHIPGPLNHSSDLLAPHPAAPVLSSLHSISSLLLDPAQIIPSPGSLPGLLQPGLEKDIAFLKSPRVLTISPTLGLAQSYTVPCLTVLH